MLDLILKFGGLLGFFTVPVSVYLYFESRRFKILDAEKEYRISRVELSEVESKIIEEQKAIESSINVVIRGSGSLENYSYNSIHLRNLEQEKFGIILKYAPAKSKIEARVNYFKKLKDHSVFWFLKKDKNRYPFNLVD